MNAKILVTGLATLFLSLNAIADQITLGEPQYGGNGCPAGSASATLSPDNSQLSILFDQYLVEAGDQVGRTLDRKSCNIAIPIHVPQGFSVSIFQVDYRGYTYVPRGAEARFNVEYFFAGQRGPRLTQSFRNTDEEYLISDELLATALVWSACGADTNLRVNSSMLARTNSRRDQVLATVDSIDASAGLIYHVKWKRCR